MIKRFGGKNASITFNVDENKRVTIVQLGDNYISDVDDHDFYFKTPIEIEITGRGNHLHYTPRHIGTSEAESLKFVSFNEQKHANYDELELKLNNDILEVSIFYRYYDKANTIASYTRLKNISNKPFSIEYVSNFAFYGLLGIDNYDDVLLHVPNNGWYNEANWQALTITQLGLATGHRQKSMKRYAVNNTGGWSTKCYCPMAILENTKTNQFLLFEIESNNSWAYELGDYIKSLSLHISGPNYIDNGYIKKLLPNQIYETVVATITLSDSLDNVIEGITHYRRNIVIDCKDNKEMPIIFNEYMFGSWNCPSEATALHFSKFAKEAGADYYVIDCGWHDEVENPFYHVGHWKPSKMKYPEGLKTTLDKVRKLGLKVGLWLEPEVVGNLGDARSIYPDEAYFHRNGEVMLVSDRYQLDFRNKLVVDNLNKIIDDLVVKYEIDYFKFDYNIEPCNGSDLYGSNPGDALFEHSLAVKKFYEDIRKRYPNVVIETCASGGNRMDYMTLGISNMVSTSDQVNYQLYPYITTNILSLILPEQAGVWCYPAADIPTEEINDEKVVMNVVNSLVGRMHLASDLAKLNKTQFELLKEGIRYYKYLTPFKKEAVPFYPNGFARKRDKFLISGLKTDEKAFIFAYVFDGGKYKFKLPFEIKNIKIGYPSNSNIKINYCEKDSTVELEFNNLVQSCVLEIDRK